MARRAHGASGRTCPSVGRRGPVAADQLDSVSDVDDDPSRACEPEHAEPRSPAESKSERDHAFEVPGGSHLPKIAASRRQDARQKIRTSGRVSTRGSEEDAYAFRSKQRNRIAGAFTGHLLDVSNIVTGPRRTCTNDEPVERRMACRRDIEQLGLATAARRGLRCCAKRRQTHRRACGNKR
jgi:hypothetical protein